MTRHDPPEREDPTEPGAREAVLECAGRLLDDGGTDSLTIRRLAEDSGFSPPAIYRMFGDKAGLVDALVARALGRVVDRMGTLENAGDARDYARRAFREIVDFGREHQWDFRAIGEQVPMGAIDSASEELNAPLVALADANRIADDDLELVRQTFWILLHGLISLPAGRPDVEWRADLVDVCFEAMLTGILAIRGESRDRDDTA